MGMNIDRIRRTGCAVLAFLVVVTASAGSVHGEVTGQTPVISGSITLAEAVETARKYSPMIQMSASEAAAAQARVGMAKSMTRPQVGVSAFAGNSSMGDIISSPPGVMPPSIFAVPDTSGVSGQVGLMVPLYTGGRLKSAVRSAQALSTAASSDRATTERNVAQETKVAYHGALLAQATVDVYTNLVKEEQERVRIAEAAFREGKIAKYDLLRNQAGLAESQQMLANAERDAQMAFIDLKTMMGVDMRSDFTLADSLAYAQVPGEFDSYLATAEQNRPELVAARSRVKAAEVNVGGAKSAYNPQVYGNAMQGLTAGSDGSETGFTVGITVGLPIVDGGQRKSAVREAEAMLESAKNEERQALIVVRKDVYDVWAELQAAEKNAVLSETAVEQAQEDYRVIRLRYESGKAVNVEVLDALASLVRAQNNRLMALYEHNVARDRLARAIGGI